MEQNDKGNQQKSPSGSPTPYYINKEYSIYSPERTRPNIVISNEKPLTNDDGHHSDIYNNHNSLNSSRSSTTNEPAINQNSVVKMENIDDNQHQTESLSASPPLSMYSPPPNEPLLQSQSIRIASQSSTSSPQNDNDDEEEEYDCVYCSASFRNIDILMQHHDDHKDMFKFGDNNDSLEIELNHDQSSLKSQSIPSESPPISDKSRALLRILNLREQTLFDDIDNGDIKNRDIGHVHIATNDDIDSTVDDNYNLLRLPKLSKSSITNDIDFGYVESDVASNDEQNDHDLYVTELLSKNISLESENKTLKSEISNLQNKLKSRVEYNILYEKYKLEHEVCETLKKTNKKLNIASYQLNQARLKSQTELETAYDALKQMRSNNRILKQRLDSLRNSLQQTSIPSISSPQRRESYSSTMSRKRDRKLFERDNEIDRPSKKIRR